VTRIGIEVPGEILEGLVSRELAIRVELLQANRELVGEPEVRPALTGRFRRLEVPLEHPLGVGK
jgi:hypothetical protein